MAARVHLPWQGFELVMYGDSIMETLRGTDHGLPCGRAGCPEGPGILHARFGDRWRTAVVATGGEQRGLIRAVSSAVDSGDPERLWFVLPA